MSHPSPLIHIVDDDASYRTALARLLEASGYRVALYASAAELLETSPPVEAGCILLDIHMEGLSGLELQERLVAAGNRLPIVFLTGHADVPSSVRAIKAGAEDFLTKPARKDVLLAAVQRALARFRAAAENDEKIDVLRLRLAKLTPREREVLDLVVRGKLNKQIAYQLGTSERTIKAHRHNIMHKLQMESLAELVLFAERVGVLEQVPVVRAQ
jgi:RNA polymerase sigma factor (sigma-70 family)